MPQHETPHQPETLPPRDETVRGWTERSVSGPTSSTPRAEEPGLFSERLVMMGLELEMLGKTVSAALGDMRSRDPAGLIALLEAAPTESRIAETMWHEVATQETIEATLAKTDGSFDLLDRLLPRLGLGASEPLLNALTRSDKRTVREGLARRLAALGPVVAYAVTVRLRSSQTDAAEQLLWILNEIGACPDGLSVARHVDHSDTRVREQAYRLAIRCDLEPEEVIERALRETEPRLLEIGLGAPIERFPSSAEPLLRHHVGDAKLPVQLRIRAARALCARRSEAALEALVRAATRRRGPFRRSLAAVSPVTLEILRCVAADYRHLPKGRELLDMAAGSSDPRVREAVEAASKSPAARPDGFGA